MAAKYFQCRNKRLKNRAFGEVNGGIKMAVITMKQLLEAGVHFGHQTKKWNPKMDKYIYAARNDIHIIDLQITVGLVEEAYKYVVEAVKDGKTILFVGTKKQAQDAVKEEAERCGMYYVNSRWLGGTLTNFKTIRSRIDRMVKLEKMELSGEFDLLPKKEVAKLKEEMGKLQVNLNGIRDMNKLPGVMFIVDPHKEEIAVKEARKLNIPIVAITDTNCDPDVIDCVIPGNDDAIRAVKLISSVIANAVIEANQGETPVYDIPEESAEPASIEEVVAKEEAPAEEVKAEAVAEEAPAKKPATKKTVKKAAEEVKGEAVAEETAEKPKAKRTVKKAAAAEEVKEEVKAEQTEEVKPVKKTTRKKKTETVEENAEKAE